MRGRQDAQITMLAFVDLEERVAPDHWTLTRARIPGRAASVVVSWGTATRLAWQKGARRYQPTTSPERGPKGSG
jgi:hypothetical protein